MHGYIEIKEDSFEDTIEHLHRLKEIACKMIKKLSEHSEIYSHKDYELDEHEYRGRRRDRDRGGRYDY